MVDAYLICTSPRSGRTMFYDLLRQNDPEHAPRCDPSMIRRYLAEQAAASALAPGTAKLADGVSQQWAARFRESS